jgi:hypothetical protein
MPGSRCPRDRLATVNNGAAQVRSEHHVVHLLERRSILDVDGEGPLWDRHSRRIPHQARHGPTIPRAKRALQLGGEPALAPHTRLTGTTRGLCAHGQGRDRRRDRRPGCSSSHQELMGLGSGF